VILPEIVIEILVNCVNCGLKQRALFAVKSSLKRYFKKNDGQKVCHYEIGSYGDYLILYRAWIKLFK